MNTSVMPLVCAVLWMASSVANGEIYKCTDRQGQVQYRDTPCGETATIIRPAKGPVTGNRNVNQQGKTRRLLNAYQEERRLKREAEDRRAQKQKESKRNCIMARDRLKRFSEAARISRLDEEGNRIVLSDTERNRATEEARREVAHWCTDS